MLPLKLRLLSYKTFKAFENQSAKRNLKPSEAIFEFLDRLEDLYGKNKVINNWRSSLLKLDRFFKERGKSILNAQKNDFHCFVIENSKKHDRYTKEPGKLQFSTIRKYLCNLLNFYEFCDVFGIEYTGDKRTLERMRHMRIEPPPVTTPLTQKEINDLLKELHQKIYRFIRLLAIVHIIYATGLKTSELLKIKLENLNFKDNSIKFYSNNGQARIVFMTDECASYIRLYMETARPFFLKDDSNQFLLVNQKGGICNLNDIVMEIKRLGKEAGIDRKIYPHLIRITFAHHLYESGMDMHYIQKLMGYKSRSTIEKLLGPIPFSKICQEYSKLFDYPNIDTHKVFKEKRRLDPLLKDYEALEPK